MTSTVVVSGTVMTEIGVMTTPLGARVEVRVEAEDKLADNEIPELIDDGAGDEMLVVLAMSAVVLPEGTGLLKSGEQTPNSG